MKLLISLLLLVPSLPLTAEVWTAGDCPNEHAAERAELKKRLLAAEPGSELYLPHPFPATDEQAVEDFLVAHRRVIDRQEGDVLPDDRRFFETVDAGQARFVVSRVANWTPSRCGPRYETNFYFLVRVFDERNGEEITRAAIADSGQIFQLMHRPENKSDAAFAISELPKLHLPASFGRASAAQYVQTTGPTLRCPALKPCIAFKSGGRTYLSVRSRLYRLETEEPISYPESFATPRARAAFLAVREGRPEAVVSLGGDRMALAIPVAP
ncbi:MAG TPA: hypothetical protein VHF50_01655 [Solirubrobacterales bacterium]|nr:hypothetical protein [Solirubrobacterales bacterium]